MLKEKLLTVKEAARYLDVSKDFIYRRVQYETDVVKVGRGIRFTLRALEKWVANNTVAGSV